MFPRFDFFWICSVLTLGWTLSYRESNATWSNGLVGFMEDHCIMLRTLCMQCMLQCMFSLRVEILLCILCSNSSTKCGVINSDGHSLCNVIFMWNLVSICMCSFGGPPWAATCMKSFLLLDHVRHRSCDKNLQLWHFTHLDWFLLQKPC